MNLAKNIARSIVSPLSTRITEFIGRIAGGGGFLPSYPGAAGAYSLRSLTGSASTPVVELQRGNGDERDFTEAELTGSVTGAELVANGGFDTDSDWAKGDGWSITGGQAVCDGSQASRAILKQDNIWLPVADGEYYIMEFTVVACSDYSKCGTYGGVGSLRNFSAAYKIDEVGTYRVLRQNFTAPGSIAKFQFYANTGETLTLDNVSLKPYTPTAAELWTFANMTNGIAKQTTDTATVSIWYDQSGSGNDAVQTTRDAQPLLIKAGVTQMENGKPAIVFDGVGDHLRLGGVGLLISPWLFSVGKLRNPDGTGQILFESGPTERIVVDNGSGYAWYPAPSTQGNSLYANGMYQLAAYGVGYGETYSNGIVVDSGLNPIANIATASNASTRLGSGNSSNTQGTYNLQEIIIYPSDQSANRIGIETNINGHYGIY